MDLPFRISNALKYCDRLLLHPIGQSGSLDELLDRREGATVGMVVFMMRTVLVMLVRMFMMLVLVVVMMSRGFRGMSVRMFVTGMRVAVCVRFVVLLVCHMNVEFYSANGGFLASRKMQMVTTQGQLSQLPLQLVAIDAQIDQRAEKHVAADSAEDVQVECAHIL